MCSDTTPGNTYDDSLSLSNKKQGSNIPKVQVNTSTLLHVSVINKIQALGTQGVGAYYPTSVSDSMQKSSVTRTSSALSINHKPNVRFHDLPPPNAQRLADMHNIAANHVKEAHAFRQTNGPHLNELIERSMRRSSSPGAATSDGEEEGSTHSGSVYKYLNKKESIIKSYGESICDLHTEFENVNAKITKKYVSDPKSKGARGSDGAGGRAMAIAGDNTTNILKMASKLNALTEEDSLVQQV